MPRALVVDDHADIRHLVRITLGRAGFDVDEAQNGSEAIERLHASELPDLVVLDVQMPLLDGWDTLAAIRRDPLTTAVAVVLCTVRASIDDRERAWSLGCDGYLSKPFALDDLLRECTVVHARSAAARADHRLQQLASLRSRT